MKKTTVFFLTIGVLAIIIGGIGSVVYSSRAEHSMTETKKQSYEIKNKQSSKEIHLNLSGNADFHIITEHSNNVVMTTQSSISVSLNSLLDVNEKNNQLVISANSNKKSNGFEGLKSSIFYSEAAVTLTIPDNAEHLVIDGNAKGTIHLSTVTTQNLSMTMNNATIDVTNDVYTDKALFNTTSGDIHISDFAASNWSATSTSGDIILSRVKGSTKIETTHGEILVTDLKGEAEAKSVSGGFTLNGAKIPKKLTVESQQGDIQLHTEEISYDITIKTKTKFGDSTLFGKERTFYKQGSGSKSFDLQTKSGDILVEGPSDFDVEEDE